MSEVVVAPRTKYGCKTCGYEHAAAEGRLRGQVFQCKVCAAAEKQLRRHLGDLPEELRAMSPDESKAFFQQLHRERQNDGSLPWTTVRASLVSSLTTRMVRAHKQEVEGKFLPLAVWVAQGWPEDTVKSQATEWSDALNCWSYQVPVKSVSWSETYERCEQKLLEQERQASQGKKRVKKGEEAEDALDLPAAPSRSAAGSGNEERKNQRQQIRDNKKTMTENTKANSLAAKAVPLVTAAMSQITRMQTKLDKLDAAETEDLRKTWQETKDKLETYGNAARKTLADFESLRAQGQPEVVPKLSLPFTLEDVKATSQRAKFLEKSVRVAKDQAVDAKPKTAPTAPVKRRRTGKQT